MYVRSGFKVYEAARKQAEAGTASTEGRLVLSVRARACYGAVSMDGIVRALNRPRFLYQVWDAGQDSNGNPRRVTMAFATDDGSIQAALDHGYSGSKIPRGASELPGVTCSFVEYREAVKAEEAREVARRYLDRGYPTGVADIGREALEDAVRLAAFRAKLRACRCPVKPGMTPDDLRNIIWAVEASRGLGTDYPADGDGIAKMVEVEA